MSSKRKCKITFSLFCSQVKEPLHKPIHPTGPTIQPPNSLSKVFRNPPSTLFFAFQVHTGSESTSNRSRLLSLCHSHISIYSSKFASIHHKLAKDGGNVYEGGMKGMVMSRVGKGKDIQAWKCKPSPEILIRLGL